MHQNTINNQLEDVQTIKKEGNFSQKSLNQQPYLQTKIELNPN